MTIDALIMLAGFFVAVLPFLGFPIQWDNFLMVALGVIVIALGIFVRRRTSQRRGDTLKGNGTFVESTPASQE